MAEVTEGDVASTERTRTLEQTTVASELLYQKFKAITYLHLVTIYNMIFGRNIQPIVWKTLRATMVPYDRDRETLQTVEQSPSG